MNLQQKDVKSLIEKISSNEILLPAMQRKFVWNENQIVNLFDSILKGYPLGSFVFWNINNKQEIKKYHFYEFIKDYSERDKTINIAAGVIGKDSIHIVMDGQQRLTALNIGIKGSITVKKKGAQKAKAENWRKKQLYIKPYIPSEIRGDDDFFWKFEFMEAITVDKWNEAHERYDWYYKVSDFYNMTKKELREYLEVGQIPNNASDWKYVLNLLRERLNNDSILSYYEIENTNIEDVLEIFKRINNGGTKLSPSNLLFSTVITSWESGRDEMDTFISQVNREGIICIKEDFLIRTCMYLMDNPAAVKIEALTDSAVCKVKDNWDNIKTAVLKTKEFLKSHNISHDVISSYNSIMPIIYYFYHMKSSKIDKFLEEELFKFFVVSQLFGLFSGNSTSTLDTVRKHMCKDQKLGAVIEPFRFDSLFDIDLSAGRINAFKITKEQIEKLVDTTYYGDVKAYIILCFLQPEIKVTNIGNYYDIDHVCSKDELKKFIKYKKGDKRQHLENLKNGIPNLQLLDYRQNRNDKNAATLYEWVVNKRQSIKFDPFKDEDTKMYKLNDINTFEDFYSKRREMMVNALYQLLQ